MNSPSGTRFGNAAEAYHRLRPTPPPTTVDWLTDTGTATPIIVAAEFGAGTGLFTAALTARIDTVFAIEPDPRMRAALVENCPGVTVLDGTAEHLPLHDDSVQAVFSHAAWHWADPELAFPEMARVLVHGGVLGTAWTIPDRRVGWRAKLDEITGRNPETARSPGRFDVPQGAPFSPPEQLMHSWTMRMTTDDLVASLATYDHVLGLPDEERTAVLDDARTYLNGNPATSRGVIDVPFRTVCFRTRYLGTAPGL
jgi:SAM-dependent methyltransferase